MVKTISKISQGTFNRSLLIVATLQIQSYFKPKFLTSVYDNIKEVIDEENNCMIYANLTVIFSLLSFRCLFLVNFKIDFKTNNDSTKKTIK